MQHDVLPPDHKRPGESLPLRWSAFSLAMSRAPFSQLIGMGDQYFIDVDVTAPAAVTRNVHPQTWRVFFRFESSQAVRTSTDDDMRHEASPFARYCGQR